MSKVLVSEENLTNIANSIREKTGTTDTYKPSEMASAISGIQSGGGIEKGVAINKFDDEGYATDVTLVGMTEVPFNLFYTYGSSYSYYTTFSKIQNVTFTPNTTSIGYRAFYFCSALNIPELPETIETLESNCFYGCTSLKLTKLPSKITEIPRYCFYRTGIQKLEVLGNVTYIADNAFGTNSGTAKLELLIFHNITNVPTFGSEGFYSTQIGQGNGYIYVPDGLVDSFKSATNWSRYADQIKPVSFLGVKTVQIASANFIHIDSKTRTLNVTYNDGETSLYYSEQEGYTISVSGNATLDGNVLTLTDNAQVGDIITVTVTSTYDTSISSTQEIEVVYIEPSFNINLNDGQWIDSGTTADNGNVIYKSDAGSYNIASGKSIAILTVSGYTSVKLYIRSYAEGGFDFTEAFAVDTPAVYGNGLFTTKGKQSATDYIECIYELDGGTHTIEIMYAKDSGGNNNDDRGYFYIGEVS